MNLPQAFEEKIKNLLGDEYDDYLECFNRQNHVGIRVNTLKISKEEFLNIFPYPLEAVPWTDNGFYYAGDKQLAKHAYYYAGLYYIQEASAMTPASFLPIEPGDKVLDLCAAPGGKSTELGAKLQGKGVLVANDISNSRAKALLKNIELFGIANGIVLSEDPKKLEQRFEGYFDKILIDAPCSGEGMFRKDPAMIRNWSEESVTSYAAIQREIVLSAVKMLKPGGTLLYSTCTFSPEENEGTIEYLLDQCKDMHMEDLPMYEGFDTGHKEWIHSNREELNKCRRLWPHRIKGEGHFIAMCKKDIKAPQNKVSTHSYKGSVLSSDCLDFLKNLNLTIDLKRIEIFDEKVYLLPEGLADIKGLRILRSGLYLGDIKKNRFEPSQALAMVLNHQEFTNTISIPIEDDRVIKYLKCETISLDGAKGYTLILVDQYPLGWGKLAGGTLKNKYYAGWRWM